MAKRKPKTVEEETAPTSSPSKGYTVLARRYRPQQFADLVGQEAVAQALMNAIQTDRVAHAYLFTGARGVGKTSAARILAKALNCVKGPTTTPCGRCANCEAIASGDDVDVLEIDGASNNKVDEVRELRGNVQYRPSHSRYKIYIIDEVHMLSTSAFNALLKTLEEPPPHVKFIFATTEANKIPLTILSRCQRFDFGGISLPRIVERLKQIVAGEGMEADDDALQMVARRAGGSMRDAQSLLDQLLAFSGERLTADRIHELLGTAHEERVAALAGAVLQKDAKQALELLAQQADRGQQLGELLDQLLEYWRDLMVARCAGVEGQDFSVSGAHREALAKQAETLSLDTILAGMDLLVAAKSRLRGTSQVRVILEMALVRLSELDTLVPLSQLAQWVKEGVPASTVATPGFVAGNAASRATPVSSPDFEKKKPAASRDIDTADSQIEFSEDNAAQIWQQIVDQSGFALRSELRKIATVAISGPNALVLRVLASYNGPGPGALDPARVAAPVEALLARVTGQACTVRVEWVEQAENGQKTTAGSVAGPASASAARQLRDKVKQLPLVQKARSVLDAEILSVEPEFGETASARQAADDTGIDDPGSEPIAEE